MYWDGLFYILDTENVFLIATRRGTPCGALENNVVFKASPAPYTEKASPIHLCFRLTLATTCGGGVDTTVGANPGPSDQDKQAQGSSPIGLNQL